MVVLESIFFFLILSLSSVTLSDCFQHFSLTARLRQSSTKLNVASPNSKYRIFSPQYQALAPVDIKAFNEPVTTDEIVDSVFKVVEGELSDQECNLLCWRTLGYKYDQELQNFTNENLLIRWKNVYPHPVDLIGLFNTSNTLIDRPVKLSSKELWHTTPERYRNSLKDVPGYEHIDPDKLSKNSARRVIIASWLIYFVNELIGKTAQQIYDEWAANRTKKYKAMKDFRKEINAYRRDSKGFRIIPSTEEKPPNRSQRNPIAKNKRDRRDADGL